MLLKICAISFVVVLLGISSYIFINGRGSAKGEIVITDKDVLHAEAHPAPDDETEMEEGDVQDLEASQVRSQDPGTTTTLIDGSTLTTIVDGNGNKSETRLFQGHSRIRMLLVRTSTDGSTSVYVYPHLGGVKRLYKESRVDVRTVSADELAAKAEVFETRLDKERQNSAIASGTGDRLRPLSSSEFQLKSEDPVGSGDPDELETDQKKASRTNPAS